MTISNSPRPAIPQDVARAVRQRCGFACVACRCPIYDYDHIVPYASVSAHEAANLILLCPTCHRKKSRGLLSMDQLLERQDVLSKSNIAGEPIDLLFETIDIGSNVIDRLSGTIFSIQHFGLAMLRHDKQSLLNLRIFAPDGQTAVEIIDNVYHVKLTSWDVESVGPRITFRASRGDVFAELFFDAQNHTLKVRGSVSIDPQTVLRITDNGIFVNRKLLASGNKIGRSRFGLVVVEDPKVAYAAIPPGGEVSHNYFQGVPGAAIYDARSCENNIVLECHTALIWSFECLRNLAHS